MTEASRAEKANPRRRLGQLGEAVAADHLEALGYQVRARNFRCPLGEIDLVADEAGELVFIEVKARTSLRFGLPREAVSRAKQRKLGRAALWYCDGERLGDRSYRFDVVEVLFLRGEVAAIELLRNAFVPPE
jgi:putative endonuclease